MVNQLISRSNERTLIEIEIAAVCFQKIEATMERAQSLDEDDESVPSVRQHAGKAVGCCLLRARARVFFHFPPHSHSERNGNFVA